ncbi:MAG: NADH-quinone oxidoreductase subunit M [Cyclobacteriaceae bacterium]|nr:NADH-quinone oxidoreductase subunit M [Cyclobacteriaceae bacterium]
MNSSLLSVLIFIPLIGTLLVLFVPSSQKVMYKYIALVVSLLQMIVVSVLYNNFDTQRIGNNTLESFQFVEKISWINLQLGELGELSIEYFVGVDGISISMVILSVFVVLIGVLSSWNVTEKGKGYFALFLLLNAAIIGCFVALDFFLFYLFFELMLLPMYFLIGIWGGKRREYASIKFFLYTLLGSIFILVVMIALYVSVELPNGAHTFNLLSMMDSNNYSLTSLLSIGANHTILGVSARNLAFLFLFIGFAIKIPVVPVHTWLPDAHVQAPTAISVILAGILLKIGGYGLIRIAYPIFPEAAIYYAWLVGFLGVVSIIYGAFNALSCTDLKKMIAYSSVSHMGFVLLGLASLTVEGVTGSIFQMFSHGIISSGLFLIAGVVYDRTGDRRIDNYSGLAHKMPKYTVVVVMLFFASLGLPGFSGFIAEVLVFLGAFKSEVLPEWMAISATFGLLLGAGYYLWTIQRMFFGKYFVRNTEKENNMVDLSKREFLMFIPLVFFALLLGVFPHFLLDILNTTVNSFIAFMSTTGIVK